MNIFGDLSKADDVSRAVAGQDAVLHLDAILSPASGPHPELYKVVNVGGMANLIHAMQASVMKAALVSGSSAISMWHSP